MYNTQVTQPQVALVVPLAPHHPPAGQHPQGLPNHMHPPALAPVHLGYLSLVPGWPAGIPPHAHAMPRTHHPVQGDGMGGGMAPPPQGLVQWLNQGVLCVFGGQCGASCE